MTECICDKCHFGHELRIYESGKRSKCCNIGVDGWEYWLENGIAPETCEEFCKVGEYVPTGIWAEFTKVVEAVAEMVEDET